MEGIKGIQVDSQLHAGSKKEGVGSCKQPVGSCRTICRELTDGLQAVKNYLQGVDILPAGGRHTPYRQLPDGL